MRHRTAAAHAVAVKFKRGADTDGDGRLGVRWVAGAAQNGRQRRGFKLSTEFRYYKMIRTESSGLLTLGVQQLAALTIPEL
jgi:hypothetical protein